jgi:hypothetical protein
MGVIGNISAMAFPKQGDWLGKRVEVCFQYNADHTIGGMVVRDDREEPFRTLIRLDDGRYVLTTECQHTLPVDPSPPDDRSVWLCHKKVLGFAKGDYLAIGTEELALEWLRERMEEEKNRIGDKSKIVAANEIEPTAQGGYAFNGWMDTWVIERLPLVERAPVPATQSKEPSR